MKQFYPGETPSTLIPAILKNFSSLFGKSVQFIIFSRHNGFVSTFTSGLAQDLSSSMALTNTQTYNPSFFLLVYTHSRNYYFIQLFHVKIFYWCLLNITNHRFNTSTRISLTKWSSSRRRWNLTNYLTNFPTRPFLYLVKQERFRVMFVGYYNKLNQQLKGIGLLPLFI